MLENQWCYLIHRFSMFNQSLEDCIYIVRERDCICDQDWYYYTTFFREAKGKVEGKERQRERTRKKCEREGRRKKFFFVEKGSKRRAGKENSAPTRKQNLEYFDGIKLHPAMASNSNHRGTSSGIQIGSAWFQRKINLRPQHRGVHLVTEEILRQMPELGQFSVGLCHVQSERLFHFFFSFSVTSIHLFMPQCFTFRDIRMVPCSMFIYQSNICHAVSTHTLKKKIKKMKEEKNFKINQ